MSGVVDVHIAEKSCSIIRNAKFLSVLLWIKFEKNVYYKISVGKQKYFLSFLIFKQNSNVRAVEESSYSEFNLLFEKIVIEDVTEPHLKMFSESNGGIKGAV